MPGAPAISEVDVPSGACLTIHVSFVTDRCVATRVDDRERPEWPPHPGRVYMALVAAHFETDGPDDDKLAERAALKWLAALPAPRIRSVESEERSPVTYFVPVNDSPKPNKAMLQSAPGMPRSRQPRTFPTVIPHREDGKKTSDPDVSFEWSGAGGFTGHLPALDRLCRNVIRVGHSSSLVMAWTEAAKSSDDRGCWEPTDARSELTCRIAAEGEFERLKDACRADRIDLFAQLKSEIDSSKGKAKTAAKAQFEEAFAEPYKTNLRAPEPTPASLGVWQGYRLAGRSRSDADSVHLNTYFERELLILAKHDGPTLNVERTLGLTQSLRLAAIQRHADAQIPAWLSGHDADHSPTSEPHAAFLALPFAGFPHADGHLMGLAIALPRGVSAEERGRWLGPLVVDQHTGEVATIKLWGKGLPDWSVQLEDQPSPPLVLRNETWTKASTTWASVTPVVLDRFPKTSREKDREGWHVEVTEIITVSCTRAGLPEPLEVDIDSTAWHTGVPRAWSKTRRLCPQRHDRATAALGDGFPSLPVKSSRPAKPQVHVWLRFDGLVSGPILIGSGRFRGYGLCKPVKSRKTTPQDDNLSAPKGRRGNVV